MHQVITLSKVSIKSKSGRKNEFSRSEWGWNIESGDLIPTQTSKPSAPDELLNMISCSCVKGCSSMRLCRKAGQKENH